MPRQPLGAGTIAWSLAPAEQIDPKVRKMPSWPRSWANFSLLQLYSHRNAWANLHLLGQPNTFLAAAGEPGCSLRLAQEDRGQPAANQGPLREDGRRRDGHIDLSLVGGNASVIAETDPR